MNRSPELDSVIQVLNKTKTATIFIPEKPTLDQVAASLSLFLSLQSQIKTHIVCSSPMTVSFSRLVGVNKISTRAGGRDLIVSFDYLENAVDKVSYNIENKKFNLVIKPKAGFPSLPSKNVSFSYSGDLGLMIIMGARSLNDLGSVYREEKKIFDQRQILNINISAQDSRFGSINLLVPGASSYSEIIVALLAVGNYSMNRDIASNLLLGIQEATGNFSSPRTKPEAFEAAAFCLRADGRRQPSFFKSPKETLPEDDLSLLRTMSRGDSAIRPPSTTGGAQVEVEEKTALESKREEEKKRKESFKTGKKPKKTPSDWYGPPKIYRGSTRA